MVVDKEGSAAARDIAIVFQNYALYPHMTVAQNMAFSLKLAKVPKTEIQTKVNRAAEILGLQSLLERHPGQLSGGQRQRVAMGHAIVRDPEVILFDEPLSNLDAKLRVQMRSKIKELHQRLRTTTIYVTHDQIEAMTMADKIVVMHDGIIEQIGSPLDLYDGPRISSLAVTELRRTLRFRDFRVPTTPPRSPGRPTGASRRNSTASVAARGRAPLQDLPLARRRLTRRLYRPPACSNVMAHRLHIHQPIARCLGSSLTERTHMQPCECRRYEHECLIFAPRISTRRSRPGGLPNRVVASVSAFSA
ncbi:ABC transporter ATP-binding protein [Mesorhizobium sp.]|uniref:ABC transporter ATP-binding protein n=1 Tax=Mesorhizobium sp. TaxID=1871066 RepID=UPI0025D92D1C|nr:ATP-binding cassette domain-containing protein [Mesorhizobium sp.]